MRIAALCLFILVLVGRANALPRSAGGACDKQLTFDFNKKPILVMSPKGSMSEKDRIYEMVDYKSRESGFQPYFGINFLEQAWKANPQTVFRFTKLKLLGVGQIQLLVYEGVVTDFERDLQTANIELSTHTESVPIRVHHLDTFYIL